MSSWVKPTKKANRINEQQGHDANENFQKEMDKNDDEPMLYTLQTMVKEKDSDAHA